MHCGVSQHQRVLAERAKHGRAMMDWIRRAVLAVDLDLTLIRPAPLGEGRPTAFPIVQEQDINVGSELGRRYLAREHISDLCEVLSLPWRVKLPFSMSVQTKVEEIGRRLLLGGIPLERWVDACVGVEYLRDFCQFRNQSRGLRSSMLLNYPTGTFLQPKPPDFLFLEESPGVGSGYTLWKLH
jgi:hypothetical protein